MLVRERMSRRLITIGPDQTVSEASQILVRRRIRQLPVVRDGQLVGIVTNRDLRAADPSSPVSMVMTAKPFTIAPDAAVDEAARLLRAYRVGALPVVEAKQLVGILTVADVLDAFVAISGVGEATYRLVLTGGRGPAAVERVRRAVEHGHGELRWVHRDSRARPHELHLRVKARRIDDVVTALEADGFDVLRVVSPQT